ncbi:UvrD-helicase domain-containing protein, partial [bacterium]|nr:UvrD-helicase domain-containing protein [bacterium]
MKLNQQQQAAVNHRDGPILILAGAGSGKTRVIVNRIVSLISDKEIPPWQILAVTFTNKAATEMKERVEAFNSIPKPSGITMGTFHSICVRILRSESEKIGLHRNFTICDDSEQIARIKMAIAEVGLDTDRIKPKAIQSSISKAKNNFESPEIFERNAGNNIFRVTIAKVYQIYEKSLKADHSVDFDDLIIKTVKLFCEEPGVLEKYQNRYRYIMIDEYQDTNRAQYELVIQLGQRFRNVMAVGDDDQSIYRWRGAEISNILNFTKDFPGSRTIKLEQNYRSTQIILSAATGLMLHNQERHPKTLWSEKKDGEKVEYSPCSSDRVEAETIGKIILSKVENENKSFKDFAVFYRINAQSRILEESFQGLRIPNQIVGNISFFKRKEVKDL